MKLTKEALKQIIKEELEGVLETSRGRFGQKQNRSRIVTKDRQPQTTIMDLRTAKAFLKFGWGELEDDQKEKIKALADRLYNIRKAEGGKDFKKAKENEYNTLIDAIEAAGGTFTPTTPVADENSKGEQEDG